MASVYAHFIQTNRSAYGRNLDINRLLSVFDGRLDRELMGLKESVFKEPLSHLATLLRYYSVKKRLWDFIREVTGEAPGNWAKILVHYVHFWSDGRQEINDEITRVPDDLLSKAFQVLRSADLTKLADHERKAALVFVEWWSQTHRGSDGKIIGDPDVPVLPPDPAS